MLGNPGYKILKFLFAENTVLGFGVRNSALQESGILEMIGIRNPSSAGKKEFEIQYLKSVIHSVESRGTFL